MTDIVERTKVVRSTILRELRTTVGYLKYVLSLKHGNEIREAKSKFLNQLAEKKKSRLLEETPMLKEYGKIERTGIDKGFKRMRKPVVE